MVGKNLIRKIILGDTRVESKLDYSRMMLTGQLALLAVAICAFYAMRDLS